MGYYKALLGKGEGDMIEKTVTIDGKEYTFRSSALLPKLYRAKFGRDLVVEMRHLAEAYKEAKGDEEKMLDAFDLEIFERVAWLMLKHAGNEIPDDPDDWLLGLDGPFSVYEALPTILELWGMNNKTTSVPRKKPGQQSASRTARSSC